MIRYSLRCARGHGFESWFQNADAFDRLKDARHVACPECGATDVEKAVMAPRVSSAASEDTARLSDPVSEREKALREIRRRIESESDYVGRRFAKEARAMHDGDMPMRPIYGEARGDEAIELLKDGIPVAPLPFVPKSETN